MVDDRTPEEKAHDEEQARLDAEFGGPNPELYARVSKPYPTAVQANEQLNKFLHGVKALREELGIAEVLVLGAVHFVPDTGLKETMSVKALALGSPDARAQLGALAFQQYTAPEIERAEELRRLATEGGPRRRSNR